MKADRTSSYLSFALFKRKGAKKMFLRFVLLGICLTFVIFFMDVLLPKIKLKIRLHKELKNKKQKQEAFRKKMKELEIK